MIHIKILFITLKILSVIKIDDASIIGKCPIGYQGDNCDECGIVYSENNVKIVGGINAVPGSWPSIALITWNYKADIILPDGSIVTDTFFSMCGGTLIDRQTILTAAHCIPKTSTINLDGIDYPFQIKTNNYYPTIESMFTVYLGLQAIDFDELRNSSSKYNKHSALKVVMHEDYDEANFTNDIALIFLTNIVELTQNIQIACLPIASSNTYPGINKDVYAVGWGTTSFQGNLSNILQNVKLSLYDSYNCGSREYGQICAGNIAGGKDTCQGDSGGPLFYMDKIKLKRKYVVSGITSNGNQCALPGYPGIYTRVSYYLDWINSQTCENDSVSTETSLEPSTTPFVVCENIESDLTCDYFNKFFKFCNNKQAYLKGLLFSETCKKTCNLC